MSVQYDGGLLPDIILFKKYLNASERSEHPPPGAKLSKGLGGNIGCRDKNSSWYQKGSLMVVTSGQQYNIRAKPSVMLYTYINPCTMQGHQNDNQETQLV